MGTPAPAWLLNGRPPSPEWAKSNLRTLKQLIKRGGVVQQGFMDGLLHRWQDTGEPFAFWEFRRKRVWVRATWTT